MVLKKRAKERNRRNTSEGIPVNVDGETVTTWYYSPKEIQQLAQNQFDVKLKKPIGLFIPPSYLAQTFKKRKTLFSMLKTMDKYVSFPFLSNYADHYIIHLMKKRQ